MVSIRLAQISDIHVSSPYFRRDWWGNVLGLLDKAEPDLVAITGDLTMDGYAAEYDRAEKVLSDLTFPRIVVPGNHDAMNLGYVTFKEVFGTRKPYYEDGTVAIQGLDSTLPDLNEGEVGRHNYPLMRNLGSIPKVRIVALHHHAVPVPGTGRETNILLDSGDFIKTCMDSDAHIVLSGHKHLPWIWHLNGVFFITAGTACTDRLKGRSFPSINIFDIERDRLRMDLVDVSTGCVWTKIDSPLKTTPGPEHFEEVSQNVE